MAFHVGVIDSSAAINLKALLKSSTAWDVLAALVECAENGKIAICEQVHHEVCVDKKLADVPGMFVSRAYAASKHPKEVDPEVLNEVLANNLGSLLVPVNSRNPHHADPYVVAQALQIERMHFDVSVVCDEKDYVTKDKATIPAVCSEFNLQVSTMKQFLDAEGIG